MLKHPVHVSLLLGLLLVGTAVRAESVPPPLPDSVQQYLPQTPLQLLGYGHFRKLVWSVFDASLWVSSSRWSLDEPFVLELRYARNFKGADIVESTEDQWKALGHADPARVGPWLQRLGDIFPDLRKGDQLIGLYLPGQATRFFHNGREVGAVEDPAFGPVFFAIWLDPKTSESKLREELLGLRCAKPGTMTRGEVGSCGGATMPGPASPRPGAARP